eukprot:2486014-Alexandrium_andersonii.AAC.1
MCPLRPYGAPVFAQTVCGLARLRGLSSDAFCTGVHGVQCKGGTRHAAFAARSVPPRAPVCNTVYAQL